MLVNDGKLCQILCFQRSLIYYRWEWWCLIWSCNSNGWGSNQCRSWRHTQTRIFKPSYVRAHHMFSRILWPRILYDFFSTKGPDHLGPGLWHLGRFLGSTWNRQLKFSFRQLQKREKFKIPAKTIHCFFDFFPLVPPMTQWK